MPAGLWNQEFLNANSQRRYPITEDSDGADTTATVRLPDDFLVSLDLPVSAGMDVDPSRFYVASVGIYATGVSVVVGYQPSVGAAVNVASASIPRDTFVPNTTYALGGINDYADTVGKITIGSLDTVNQQANGLFSFALAHTRIEPDCVRPIIRGVTAILLSSGGATSQPLYGDIELVAQENMQLVPVVVAGQNPVILLSAIQGEGLAEACVCEGVGTDVPIQRINGIPPTVAGDFTLLGSDCVDIAGIANGLKITDTCSKPCCGCQELEAITRDLESFGSKATTLENFLNRLESSVDQMNLVVLGSKLNDTGCVST